MAVSDRRVWPLNITLSVLFRGKDCNLVVQASTACASLLRQVAVTISQLQIQVEDLSVIELFGRGQI